MNIDAAQFGSQSLPSFLPGGAVAEEAAGMSVPITRVEEAKRLRVHAVAMVGDPLSFVEPLIERFWAGTSAEEAVENCAHSRRDNRG